MCAIPGWVYLSWKRLICRLHRDHGHKAWSPQCSELHVLSLSWASTSREARWGVYIYLSSSWQ